MRAIAFWSAVLAYALLAFMVMAGGAAWSGYSHLTQYISELGAAGAPHGRLVSLGAFLPVGVLLSLFAVLAMLLPPRGLLRTLGFLGLIVFAAGYTAAAFFPCDPGCRPADPSPSQTMHLLFGLAGYVAAPLMLTALAISARGWPVPRWLSPLGFLCAAVSGIAFLGMAPPLEGLFQRVLEGAVAVWVLACAFALRKPPAAE
ncbi:MAG: DUF998 domain-containing protein [Pseudomonadota bacterium]